MFETVNPALNEPLTGAVEVSPSTINTSSLLLLIPYTFISPTAASFTSILVWLNTTFKPVVPSKETVTAASGVVTVYPCSSLGFVFPETPSSTVTLIFVITKSPDNALTAASSACWETVNPFVRSPEISLIVVIKLTVFPSLSTA